MVWNSLRTRIVLLAVLTCLFFGTAAGSFYLFLRNNHALTVGTQQRHLVQTADALVRAFSQQASGGLSLEHVEHPVPPEDPPPPRADATAPEPPPLLAEPPPLPPRDAYASITSSALAHVEGVEGGFLADSGDLIGYAFPTHEGPGPAKEMPRKERSTIEDLARKAKSSASDQKYSFEGDHDVVLFAAAPVREVIGGRSQVTGAAWLMQRLPGVNAGRSRQLLFASVGLGGATLITAVLAWMALFEIRGGLDAVKARLTTVKTSGVPVLPDTKRLPLQEFAGVMSDIDEMANTLHARTTNEMRLEAELRHRERLAALGQFAAGVAHEIRNPLATIRLRAQMSESSQPQQAVTRNSQVILQEVDRLDIMIERLLSFARPISLDHQLLELSAFCAECVYDWKSRVGDSVKLFLESQDEVFLQADRSRLKQVVDNLMENAIQAVQEQDGGTVTVHVTHEGETAYIRIVDNGAGFTPEAAKHALDPFYTTKDAGTGLGLSIAFELIQAHGGTLTISERQQGAVVAFTLPVHAAKVPA